MWAWSNKLVLNVSKTKSIVFGSNSRFKHNPQLNVSVQGVPVEQVEEVKLLGVLLDSRLNWSKQIDKTVASMGRGLAVIMRCAKFQPHQCISHVLQTLVLTHLDYCPVVWSSASNKDLGKLQLVQNRAARLTLNCNRRTNIIRMHRTLGWSLVKDRMVISLLFFYSVVFYFLFHKLMQGKVRLCIEV